MNYLKVVRTIAGILAFIGFVLALGAVGKFDFADEIGEYIALKDYVPQMLIGVILMIPCGLLESFLNRYEIERGEDDDNRNCVA